MVDFQMDNWRFRCEENADAQVSREFTSLVKAFDDWKFKMKICDFMVELNQNPFNEFGCLIKHLQTLDHC